MLATFQALLEAVAPTTIGSLFAWSVSRCGNFPLDYLAWLFLGAVHTIALALTMLVPRHINYRKKSLLPNVRNCIASNQRCVTPFKFLLIYVRLIHDI